MSVTIPWSMGATARQLVIIPKADITVNATLAIEAMDTTVSVRTFPCTDEISFHRFHVSKK